MGAWVLGYCNLEVGIDGCGLHVCVCVVRLRVSHTHTLCVCVCVCVLSDFESHRFQKVIYTTFSSFQYYSEGAVSIILKVPSTCSCFIGSLQAL